jgi:cytochrome c oxidase subunit 3
MNHQNHYYHLVNYSPWPLTSSLGALLFIIGTIQWFHLFNNHLILISQVIILLSIYQWWRDINRERTFQGNHTVIVTRGLQFGIILFITSEVLFFFSFFWAFFHRILSPNIELGIEWPPIGLIPFNPFSIPLLNSIILISSGISVTWTHHRIINNNLSQAKVSLLITIILGIYFTILQAYEYIQAPFCISDRSYGSTFFIATGFHGLHVIIGTLFLLFTAYRLTKNFLSSYHHFGFEAAAWYWHFVDVVWLFLFLRIYWWTY